MLHKLDHNIHINLHRNSKCRILREAFPNLPHELKAYCQSINGLVPLLCSASHSCCGISAWLPHQYHFPVILKPHVAWGSEWNPQYLHGVWQSRYPRHTCGGRTGFFCSFFLFLQGTRIGSLSLCVFYNCMSNKTHLHIFILLKVLGGFLKSVYHMFPHHVLCSFFWLFCGQEQGKCAEFPTST